MDIFSTKIEINADFPFAGFKATGLGAGTTTGDALGFGQAGSQLNGLTMIAASDLIVSAGGELTGLPATPSGDTAAASKLYVDSIADGLASKRPCRFATDAALAANTAAGSGVGKTLTANAVGALSVDGVAAAATNRVLVKNEVTGSDNGIYDVTDAGSGATPFILTRATDFDENAEVIAGSCTFINEGSVNANTKYCLFTDDPITVDTTAQTWDKISATGTVTLSGILAATGTNTIDNATFNQAWQWNGLGAADTAFTFNEVTGIGAVGAELLKIDTLAASNTIPLTVSDRGTETFRVVGGGTNQVRVNDGSGASPGLAFLTNTDKGFSATAGFLNIDSGGSARVAVSDTVMRGANADSFNMPHSAAGTAAAPTYSFPSAPTTGIHNLGGVGLGFSVGSTDRLTIDANGVATFTGQAGSATNALVDATNIATDCNDGNVHEVTITANRILDNPTNQVNGFTYAWRIIQGGAGSFTLAFGTAFDFAGGSPPSLSSAAGAVDIITAISDGTNMVCTIATEEDFGVDTHAVNHIQGGNDEVDGDFLDIDFAPTNYTEATGTVGGVASVLVDHLTAHLGGIDTALGAITTENVVRELLTVAGLAVTLTSTPATSSDVMLFVRNGSWLVSKDDDATANLYDYAIAGTAVDFDDTAGTSGDVINGDEVLALYHTA